jgi:Glycine/serine hydroxymethyltransferase
MIFYRIGEKGKDPKTGETINWDLKSKIDNSVFPGLQGGPHNHTIAALAVALKQAMTPEFKAYQSQVLKNIKHLGECLEKKGFKLATGGTDVHLILVNVKAKGVDGERVAQLFDYINISVNKNTLPGDKSAIVPSGIRLGAHCMTTRGMTEKDFEEIANFIDRGVELTKQIKEECGGPKIADFKNWLKKNAQTDQRIVKLREEVISFCSKFPYVE